MRREEAQRRRAARRIRRRIVFGKFLIGAMWTIIFVAAVAIAVWVAVTFASGESTS